MAVFSGQLPDRVPLFGCVAHDGILERFGGSAISVGDTQAVVRACANCLDLCHPPLAPQEPGREELPDGTVVVRHRWYTSRSAPTDTTDTASDIADLIEQAEAWQLAEDEVAGFNRHARQRDAWAGGMVCIHLGISNPLLPFGDRHLQRGAFAWADHRDLVRQWNRLANENLLRRLDALAGPEAGPVAMIWDDIAAKNSLIYSPEMLEELLFPHLAACCDLLHSRGIKVLFHSDGNVTKVLERLVECGIDGFNPLETTAGMDPRTFREICGRRIVLVGGIDAVEVLAHGTPERVTEETKKLIDLFSKDGNLIVASASGQVDNSMPLENVLAMYETVWQCGGFGTSTRARTNEQKEQQEGQT